MFCSIRWYGDLKTPHRGCPELILSISTAHASYVRLLSYALNASEERNTTLLLNTVNLEIKFWSARYAMNVTQHHPKVKVTLAIPNTTFVAGDEIRGKFSVESRSETALGLALISVELVATQGWPRNSFTLHPSYRNILILLDRAYITRPCGLVYISSHSSGLPRTRSSSL